MQIHLHGRLTAAESACLDSADRGFTLGDGLFETIAVSGGAPRRLPAHLARLRRGLALLRIDLPYGEAQLARFLDETLAANGVEQGAARLTVSRGPAPRGLLPPPQAHPTLLITAAAGPARREPLRAVVARSTRRNEHSPLTQVKALGSLDNLLAALEARERGAEAALLLNTAGRLAGADSANLFAVLDGRLVTPPLGEGALPGVLRQEILDRHGAVEAPLAPAALRGAEEAFLGNALGLRPLIALDDAPLGDGKAGTLTRALQAALI